jgi:hypothetical protein
LKQTSYSCCERSMGVPPMVMPGTSTMVVPMDM